MLLTPRIELSFTKWTVPWVQKILRNRELIAATPTEERNLITSFLGPPLRLMILTLFVALVTGIPLLAAAELYRKDIELGVPVEAAPHLVNLNPMNGR
jgi:hypothetical protein